MRGWGRFDPRAEQGQSFPSFVRREQLSARLQPQDIGRLVQPEVWDKQVGLAPNERLCQMAVRLLQNPFEPNRRTNHERHNQSALSGRASVRVLLARASSSSWAAEGDPRPPVRRRNLARRSATRCRCSALMGLIPDQDEPKNLAMLRLRGAAVPGRPYAQAADDIVIQVANRERRHRQGPMLSSAAMTAQASFLRKQCEARIQDQLDPTLTLDPRFPRGHANGKRGPLLCGISDSDPGCARAMARAQDPTLVIGPPRFALYLVDKGRQGPYIA